MRLKEKGKEKKSNNAIVYVDKVEKENPKYLSEMKQAYIYLAQNINTDKFQLILSFHLPDENEQEKLRILRMEKDVRIQGDLKLYKSNAITGFIMIGLAVLLGYLCKDDLIKTVQMLRGVLKLPLNEEIKSKIVAALGSISTLLVGGVGASIAKSSLSDYFLTKKEENQTLTKR